MPPDRVFEAKPVWKRMIVILAGVTMNVLFAWMIFVGPGRWTCWATGPGLKTK